jgi:hypothetical protein
MKPSFNVSIRDDVGRHRSEFRPLTRFTRELFDTIGDNRQFIWNRSYSAGDSSVACIPTEWDEKCNCSAAQINPASGILKQRIRGLAGLRVWWFQSRNQTRDLHV